MSKADFVLQTTQIFQRAVFFGLLNPQPNGACFAGSRVTLDHVDLSAFKAILLKVRGQGEAKQFKIILRHKGQNKDPLPAYENMFEVSYLPVKREIIQFSIFSYLRVDKTKIMG